MTESDGALYFTYVWDWVVKAVGLEAAIVYGVVYRYCHMRTGKCYASASTLADHVGMTRQRFSRHMATLIENGLVIDLTPDVQGVPHEYKYVERSAVLSTDSAEKPAKEEPVTKSSTTDVSQNVAGGCHKTLQPPVTDRNTSITTNITSKDYKEDDDKDAQKLGRILSIVDDRLGLDRVGIRVEKIKEFIEQYGIDHVLAGAEEFACSRAGHINYIGECAKRAAQGKKGPKRARRANPKQSLPVAAQSNTRWG